ncbi:MAG: hypothetical protein HY554_16330 [Elusimicrobia bacterium]|nr:hypothetical protein [Elusimicrobiota bacterium]
MPREDWLSFTRAGAPWVDFEWLCQLLWLGLYRVGGFPALLALKAALLAGAGAALWSTLALYKLPVAARGPWLLAWALALLPANDLRPENFSVLFFGLQWRWLERDRLSPRLRASPAERAGAAGFFMLWANLHAGFAYGLLLQALATVLAEAKSRRRLAELLVFGALGTLANPAGPGLYPVLLEHAAGLGELSGTIREWQAPSFADPWLLPFWALLAAVFAAAIRGLRSGRLTLLHLVALAFFALSAVRHVRTIPYFAAVAVPVAAAALGWAARPAARAAAWAAALVLGAFWAARVAPELAAARAFIPRYAPEGLARFLDGGREALGGKRLFHPIPWGGFLGYRLGPAYPIFADGRYLFHDLLKTVEEARREPEAFRRFLDGLGVDVVLLQAGSQSVSTDVLLKDGRKLAVRRPAYLFFMPRADWALVYWDRDGSAFVRRSSAPRAWVERREYRLYRPGDLEAAELLVRDGLARPEELRAERERWLREQDPS